VSVNEFVKTSMRNKLQDNTVVLRLKHHSMKCDDIHVLQYVRLCLILQFISGSAKTEVKRQLFNSCMPTQDAAVWQLAFWCVLWLNDISYIKSV